MTDLILVLPYQLAAVVNNTRPVFIVLALFQKRYFNTIMCFEMKLDISQTINKFSFGSKIIATNAEPLFHIKQVFFPKSPLLNCLVFLYS